MGKNNQSAQKPTAPAAPVTPPEIKDEAQQGAESQQFEQNGTAQNDTGTGETATGTSTPPVDSAPPPAAPEPAPEPAPAEQPKETVVITGAGGLSAIAFLKTLAESNETSVLAKAAINQLADYMVAMAPKKPITPEDGSRQQVSLYRAITTIINRTEGEEFDKLFTALLRLFEENKDGVFQEASVFRFFEIVALPENDRKGLLRLLNLIKVTAPIKGREIALKQLDLTNSLAYGLTEPGRQRVLAFFGQ